MTTDIKIAIVLFLWLILLLAIIKAIIIYPTNPVFLHLIVGIVLFLAITKKRN